MKTKNLSQKFTCHWQYSTENTKLTNVIKDNKEKVQLSNPLNVQLTVTAVNATLCSA
jgi:hypothetical protein